MLKPALRERLLGALVFLCLGLIFYPVIFDTREDLVVDRETQIPPQLVRVAPLTLEDPVVPDQATPPPAPQEVFMPEEAPVAASANLDTPSTILNSDGVPNAWVLQVGSFSEQKNATDQEQRLLEAGYRAYTRRTTTAEGVTRYRLFVGPYLDRGIAQADSAGLTQMGMNTPLLLEFMP